MKRFYLICLIILISPVHALVMDAHHVKRVVDGDTLLLDNNRFVRYIGINAPEVQHGNENAELFGIEAKSHNARLVGNRKIYLVYGREKSDRYGRGLGYVYTHKKIFVNRGKEELNKVLDKVFRGEEETPSQEQEGQVPQEEQPKSFERELIDGILDGIFNQKLWIV